MSGYLKNSTLYNISQLPSAKFMKMGIVVSEWNDEITRALLYGTLQTLSSHDVAEENVLVRWVPGSFELPLSASLMLENELVDAVICLGCVIQGETRHFEFICQAVAQGITQVGLQYKKPVVFGVLTTDTISQARERSGGKYGNKGIEAALAAIRMVALSHDLRSLLP